MVNMLTSPAIHRMTVREIADRLEGQPETVLQELLPVLRADRRQGVRALASRVASRLEAVRRERESFSRRFLLENRLWAEGFRYVAGVDEAGRGPLAGPVVAAAVILPSAAFLPGLNDSKQLSEARRAALVPLIKEQALAWSVAEVDTEVIDRLNIARAAFEAMRAAVAGLALRPDFVLVDGFPVPGLLGPQQGVVGGDGLSNSVAAASVLAKVHRDRRMAEYAERFPGYGFEVHKGYPTAEHREALRRLGPSPIHRRSFNWGV